MSANCEAGRDYAEAETDLLMTTAAHHSRIGGDWERVSHVSPCGIGGHIGILARGMGQGLPLVVVVGCAHLGDRRGEVGTHAVVLLRL